jgi:hypothetical protein
MGRGRLTFAEPVKDVLKHDRRGRAPLFRFESDPYYNTQEELVYASIDGATAGWLRRRALGCPMTTERQRARSRNAAASGI